MMRFELIEGDTVLMTILANDGWDIVNTFPNPYPQPYSFALMCLNRLSDVYDMDAARKRAEAIVYPKGVPF